MIGRKRPLHYLIDTDHLPDPADDMTIRVSRRGMMAAAADAAEEKLRSSQGAPSYTIEDVAGYSEEHLDRIRPAVNSRAKISLKNDVVYAETSAAVDPIPLFEIHSPALFIFNQFNGLQTVAEINAKVAGQTGWDEERTRRTVRAVFLKLCEVRICEPG